MILPGKHLRQANTLLAIGADILSNLEKPRTVSEVWERTRLARASNAVSDLSFDWFILALTFLYSIAVVELKDGVLMTQARQ